MGCSKVDVSLASEKMMVYIKIVQQTTTKLYKIFLSASPIFFICKE